MFDGTPLITVQRCESRRWPNDISSAADNAIFKNSEQNIECSFGCVVRSSILLKSNVANILLFNFYQQKFVQHGPITIIIDCNDLSLFSFEEKCLNYLVRSMRTFKKDISCYIVVCQAKILVVMTIAKISHPYDTKAEKLNKF